MKLTKAEKKRIAKALQAARSLFVLTEITHVCTALDKAAVHKLISENDTALSKRYIKHLIQPYDTVYAWCWNTHGFDPYPHAHWKIYRLAWIDHMIKELQK